MGSAKNVVLRGLVQKVDLLLFVFSPLAILCVLFMLIVLAERYFGHREAVETYQRDGIAVVGTVQRVDVPEQLVFVEFTYQGEARTGLLYTRYYPAALELLRGGQALGLRALPPSLGDRVVWEEHFDEFAGYWGYASEVLIPLLCAWALVILHPEFLYMGFSDVKQVGDEH